MKNIIVVLVVLISTLQLPAQTNAPVRLALVSESADTFAAVDILTAEFSSHKNLQLLERDEIEKAYREQGLSAGNKDNLKMGQILGADGLLLLDVVRTPQATNLMTRLIAVKPGVILTDGSFAWPLKDTAQWAESVSTYLNSLLPKLSVQAKDAIPISVVNLRSAISSDEGAETEKQLKLLTIQRLSQERQFFILERQKMRLLGEEKELKSDDSAFWNGSYLLEGVVDQNGYSRETVTINARLSPPKGGTPLLFEVSGSRTNLAEVVNQLAAKVNEFLKVNTTAKEWNSTDEASQFFDEAKWALRWGVYSEAEAAADSAWALGKHDTDCAVVRVSAYLAELSAGVGRFQTGESTLSSGYDADNKPLGPLPTEAEVRKEVNEILVQHPFGMAYQTHEANGAKIIDYVSADAPPDLKNIDRAFRVLELYYEFSRNSPESLLRVASEASGWKNSDWYNLGIEDLVAASQVLQNFNFAPDSQKPAADKLVELRALTRSVAEWISKSPSVHDSYFVGDRLATHDELVNTVEESPNIFKCEVKWGCFWQENPEDCIALYRELISSPVFCYIHKDFWLRDLQTPRLTAWTENDRQRVPMVWNNFVGELDASSNILLQLESKAIALADADSDKKVGATFTNLFDGIFTNRDTLIANPIEVLYLDWGVGDLVSAKTGNGIATPTKESLYNLYWHDGYRSKLEAMDREYQDKTVVAYQKTIDGKEFLQEFEKQKQYLKNNTPFNPNEFVQMFLFGFKDYSKTQALEIQPLLAAYKTNLTGKWARIGEMQVGQAEANVNRILKPTAPRPQKPAQASVSPQALTLNSAIAVKASVVPPALGDKPEMVTNVVTVNQSFTIPVEKLLAPDGSQRINDLSEVTVTAHHWCEGKLLLDVQYNLQFVEGNTDFAGQKSGQAIALFDSATKNWEVVATPNADIQTQNRFYNRTTLMNGNLYNCDGGEIRKYDFGARQWQTLKISDGNNYQLYAVNRQLYAANANVIFEIIDGGAGTRMLASNRRHPPVSWLDTQDLGTPVLFEGSNHSLRVSTGSKILTFTANDWREDLATPPSSFPPERCHDGMLFRLAASGAGHPVSLSFLPTENNAAELYLWQKSPAVSSITLSPLQANALSAKPLWEMPPHLFLANLPASVRQSDLYLLADHSQGQNVLGQKAWEGIIGKKFLPKDGYEATLLCYSKDFSLPQKVYLNFDAPNSCQPLTGNDPSAAQWMPVMPPVWLLCSDNFLVFGLEIPRDSIPFHGMPQRTDVGGKASVWLMPISQIEDARAAQKQIQLRQKAKEEAAAEQIQKEKGQERKNLLASVLVKYDHNHNSVIDPDEKKEALADPAFVESELDAIDANHNGWLDAEELVWFDANQNKILEPNEQAAIDIAQHLLAERLLKKFDANGDGFLDQSEFNELIQASMATNTRAMPVYGNPNLNIFPDDNRDGHVDLGELETFFKQQTRSGLRSRGTPGAVIFNQMRMNPNQPIDARQLFKAAVESYWQNSGSNTRGTQGGKVQ